MSFIYVTFSERLALLIYVTLWAGDYVTSEIDGLCNMQATKLHNYDRNVT